MKLVKMLGLTSLALAMSGCTVLGFVTDVALISALDRDQKAGEHNYARNNELFFTQEGLKHDAKVVKDLIDQLSDSNNDFTPAVRDDKQVQSLACKNVKNGKQQCYPAEYYEDMYIKDETNLENGSNSSQD